MSGLPGSELVRMDDADFKMMSRFIYTQCGIKMPPAKRTLLESRLQKRLRVAGMASFKAYLEYVFTPQGQATELIPMIDAVTTNKTGFFRGPDHFEYLRDTVAPTLLKSGRNHLQCWSAACSTGEEPYTLAMVLSEARLHHPALTYSILATDLSTRVLQRAAQAVYTEDQVADIPLALRRRYLLQSKDRQARKVRVQAALREKVLFQRMNLMDEVYHTGTSFQIIFCRNVLIYFDRPTQEQVVQKLSHRLDTGGYLFIGHSESLTQMNVPLQQIRPTIFRKL
jgi:chemotaxis protein methyltransferase CheR